MTIQRIYNNVKNSPVFSTERKVTFIVVLFVLISLLLGSISYLQGELLGGVRAYTRGEGMWAKAQKDAVLHLSRYAYSRSDSDYLAFKNAVQVNLGDQKARLALLETPPNEQDARLGFLQGQNHPSDIDALIWFFLNFKNISYLRDAIQIWEAGDAKLEELISLGEEIHHEVTTGGSRASQMTTLRARLEVLNDELLALENRFSLVLGGGARWIKQTTLLLNSAVLLVFVGIGVLVSRQIIKGIAKAERRLLTSELRFRSLTDSNTIGIVSWHLDGVVTQANTLFLDMLGYNHSDLLASRINWRRMTPVDLWPRDQQALSELRTSGRCTPYEKTLLHKAGHQVPIYIGASMLSDDNGEGIAFVIDLSERKQSEEQFKLAATVFASSNDGILITDASLRVISSNPALRRMTGYDEDELRGATPRFFQPAHGTPEQHREMWNALHEHGHWQGDSVDNIKGGAPLPIRLSISSVKNDEDKVTHYVVIVADIAARKAEEEYLRHIAHHDTLTGLPNRTLFNHRIEQLIKRAAHNHSRFAVLFYDLDNFKPVNDRYGHEVGDKLLQIVAQRLTHHTRKSDIAIRLGGDEFVLLLEDVTDKAMVEAVVSKTVASICAPCRIDGHDIDVGVSVGVSIYPENGTDANALIRHADIAMYSMKNNDRVGDAAPSSGAATERPG